MLSSCTPLVTCIWSQRTFSYQCEQCMDLCSNACVCSSLQYVCIIHYSQVDFVLVTGFASVYHKHFKSRVLIACMHSPCVPCMIF